MTDAQRERWKREREVIETRRRDEALDVLRVLPVGPPGQSTGQIAEYAFGLNTRLKRQRARAGLDRIIYDFHIRIRRRRGPHGCSTLYWIEPEDATAKTIVLEANGVAQ